MNDLYSGGGDDGTDLRVLVARIIAGRWWVIGSVVVFAVAFYAAAKILTPIYRASTLLIPAKSNPGLDSGSGLGGIGGVASLVGLNLNGGDSQTEEALAVIRSRDFTEKFINDLHLMPVLYANIWDARTGAWKTDEKHRPTPARAYHYFDKGIRSVATDKKTGLITLNVDWTDRIAAAQWANELVSRLNAEMRRREIARADLAVGYLEKEFEATSAVATREAIGRVMEAQVKQRMLATVTQEYSLRVIDPAVAPDKDEIHFPNKLLLVVGGPFFGLMFGVACVLAYGALRAPPDRR